MASVVWHHAGPHPHYAASSRPAFKIKYVCMYLSWLLVCSSCHWLEAGTCVGESTEWFGCPVTFRQLFVNFNRLFPSVTFNNHAFLLLFGVLFPESIFCEQLSQCIMHLSTYTCLKSRNIIYIRKNCPPLRCY